MIRRSTTCSIRASRKAAPASVPAPACGRRRTIPSTAARISPTQHTARKSTPEGFKERPQSGYVARAPFEGSPISGLDPVLAKELGLEVDEDAALPRLARRRAQ